MSLLPLPKQEGDNATLYKELENALKHVGVGEEERQQIMHEIPTGWGNEGGVGDLRQGIDATPQHQIRVFHNVFVLQNLYVATGFVTMVNVMSEVCVLG